MQERNHTDEGFEERILDAQSAAAELSDADDERTAHEVVLSFTENECELAALALATYVREQYDRGNAKDETLADMHALSERFRKGE